VFTQIRSCTLRLAGVAVALSIASGAGCTFARSTPLKRVAGDDYAASSNGEPKVHGKPRPFRGIPVVLEVPTHYAVTVTEACFVYRDKANVIHEVAFNSAGTPRLLNVDVQTVSRKKLFSVDFARPAGGTLTAEMKFIPVSGELTAGHIQSINNKVEEQTINQVTGVLANLGKAGLLGATGGASKGVGNRQTDAAKAFNNNSYKINRTVAYALFDVDSPGVAEQISAFLEQHVSACHECEGGAPCEHQFPEEVSTPGLGTKAEVGRVSQVMYAERSESGAEGGMTDSRPESNISEGRPMLREKDEAYLTTDAFTLYEVEVAYDQ